MTSLDSWLSFNPLDRVKFVQIAPFNELEEWVLDRFNPLDRVKFVQIVHTRHSKPTRRGERFNPLDRVKFVQIKVWLRTI